MAGKVSLNKASTTGYRLHDQGLIPDKGTFVFATTSTMILRYTLFYVLEFGDFPWW
jgi:hypothetical protein